MTLDSSFSLSSASPGHDSDQRISAGTNASRSIDSDGAGELFYGSENELLRAFLNDDAALAKLNLFPICIFGPAGSGKSELARWIANRHFSNNRLTRYAATDFYRDFVDAVDLDNVTAFRDSCLSDDRLTVLDSLNELVSKERALEEVEYLIDRSCRLIVTCTDNPAELSSIPNRISSRLMSGLSIPLAHPSNEILQLILVSELKSFNATISDEAAQWLSENVVSTIPEIRQVISTLRIQVNFKNLISLDTVKNIFSQSGNVTPKLPLIAKLVAKNQRIKVSDLTGQSRKRSIVQARGIAVYIARETYQYKYEELGRFFGNRDHSTMMHAHRKFNHEIKVDSGLASCVDEITVAIRQRCEATNRESQVPDA